MKSNGDTEPPIFTATNRDTPWPEWGDGPYAEYGGDVQENLFRMRLESQYKDDLKVKVVNLLLQIFPDGILFFTYSFNNCSDSNSSKDGLV